MEELAVAAEEVRDSEAVAIDAPVRPTFDELYRLRYDALVRVAFVLVDTQHEAEEVVQDAFAALYARYQHVDNPDAYVRRAVLNGARQVLRRRRVALQRTGGKARWQPQTRGIRGGHGRCAAQSGSAGDGNRRRPDGAGPGRRRRLAE